MYNSTMCSIRYHRGSSLTQDDGSQQIAVSHLSDSGDRKIWREGGGGKGIALQMRKCTEKRPLQAKKKKRNLL